MATKTVPVAVVISAVMLIASIVTAVIIFGPKPVGPVSDSEKPKVEAWLVWNKLDAYGNTPATPYPDGQPDDRYDYIRSNHRDRPWLTIDEAWLTNFAPDEKAAFDAWVNSKGLNIFGDPKDTMYTGGTPLFNEMTGEQTSVDKYALGKHPLRPWNYPEVAR